MESKRQQKFGRQIQKDLSDIFQKEFKELFGRAMVTVTDVKVSPDLSVARVYLSFLLAEKNQRRMVPCCPGYLDTFESLHLAFD